MTASGLPKGIALANLGGGQWGFKGFTAKAGTYLVTVKATMNGRTVSQRLALQVAGLPAWAKGTFNGAVHNGAVYEEYPTGIATFTVSSAGKISGKFSEYGTNWTFSASRYTDCAADFSAYSLAATAKYAYKVKSGKKTVTKYLTRKLTLTVLPSEFGGTAVIEADDGLHADFRQNLWGSAYKALGKQLFYASKKVQYRTYKVDALGTGDLSLKITPAGAVTATLTWDTGKKDKKKNAIIYKPTCATALLPESAATTSPDAFEGCIPVYFPPSPANNFPGYAAFWMFPF